ncbi:MAG: hypothetical protein FalmKO_14800 [Falsiruegeria mediterranea]
MAILGHELCDLGRRLGCHRDSLFAGNAEHVDLRLRVVPNLGRPRSGLKGQRFNKKGTVPWGVGTVPVTGLMGVEDQRPMQLA